MNFKQDKIIPHNNSFMCGKNRRGKRFCAKTHQIPVAFITDTVTKEISALVSYAEAFEDDFLNPLIDKHSEKHFKELKGLEISINVKKVRKNELEVLFKRMYEDRIRGLITEEQFKLLSIDFTEEQQVLLEQINADDVLIAKLSKKKLNIKKLTQILRTFTKINVLTDEIMELFVDKISVYHRDESSKERKQKIEVHYNFLGHIEVPKVYASEMKNLKKSFGRNSKENQAVLATA